MTQHDTIIISLDANETATTLKNKMTSQGLSYTDQDVESTFELLLEPYDIIKLQVNENNKVVSYIFKMKDIGQHPENET